MFTKEIENTFAISVSKEFLMSLGELLKKHFENVFCVATLFKKNTKKFASIEQLCDYENALEKRITKLEISAYNSKGECIHLFFEDKKMTSIRGIISTQDEKKTNSIYEELDYEMRRKSEGFVFSTIARIDYFRLLYIILFLFVLIVGAISPSDKTTESIGLIELLTQYFIPFVELVAIYMGFGAVIYGIKKYLFPMIVFNIGDEIIKNERRNTLKKNLTWAGFFAVVASIIGSYIYTKLTNG